MNNRLHTTAILAMTADGKIADYQSSAARFGSVNDKLHLEKQVSLVDGAIFGAGTLRAYGTTISVRNPQLLQQRREREQLEQPIQIVVSASGDLDYTWQFFQQPVPRWLITVPKGENLWRTRQEFDRIIVDRDKKRDRSIIDWQYTFIRLQELGLKKLAILGGGELVASLMAVNLIDELWLTICPMIFGGNFAPSPVGGLGFLQSEAKQLKLLEISQVADELFVHYQVKN